MKWNRCRAAVPFTCMLALAVGIPAPGRFLAAQTLDGTGAVAVGLMLRQLDGVKRVLMIGAHPDDEDTSLLTTLARGWGAETAYLSLTRGDGGQNGIGSELFEGLGVVRTGELDAARRLDGGEQFFTRAFDYGFSKSADEALTFWPHEELLGDVVWIVRRFRPQVIVSVWSGTPRDGHGQHQASGIVAEEAFEAAGDPSRFPEQLELGVEPWRAAKLYVSDRFGRGGGPAESTLRIDTGSMDPLLGRSLYQLSMESRSQHRSQDMGSPQPPGPRETGVRLAQSRVPGGEAGFFAGIDTTLVGLVGRLPPTVASTALTDIEGYREAVSRARAGFGLDLASTADDLGEALMRIRRVQMGVRSVADTETRLLLDAHEDLARRAFLAAAGITLEVRAEDDLIVPGQTLRTALLLWNGGGVALEAAEASLGVPEGWTATLTSVDGVDASGEVPPASLATWTFEVSVPEDADPSRLYYLREERTGAWYAWPNEPAVWGLSRDPEPVTGAVTFVPESLAAAEVPRVGVRRAWRYVDVDPTRGEFAKRVLVVPPVSVHVEPGSLVWPQSSRAERELSVVVHTEADGGARGVLAVSAPAGWTVTPATRRFELDEAGAERSLGFTVRPTGAPTVGRHGFEALARTDDGSEYDEGYALVDYDHIERAALFEAAAVEVTVVPVAVAEGVRIGYVMGSGDDGPEAIRQLGAPVELLDEQQVRDGAFDAFSAIVLGVRAYETRPDLRAATGQLRDFVRGGGVVVAQYNRSALGSLAPLPLDIGRGAPRVADETAPVRILAPDAPIFTTPNRIGGNDFDGWVQERGLYFASEWDDGYVPLLEMNDPGEDPARGSLLVAPEGEGVFVYAALSFFRQWDSGVAGPYRLFANLISLDPAAWRSFAAGR